jgi:hypothetical protein
MRPAKLCLIRSGIRRKFGLENMHAEEWGSGQADLRGESSSLFGSGLGFGEALSKLLARGLPRRPQLLVLALQQRMRPHLQSPHHQTSQVNDSMKVPVSSLLLESQFSLRERCGPKGEVPFEIPNNFFLTPSCWKASSSRKTFAGPS